MDFHLIYANLNIPVIAINFPEKRVLYMNAQAKIMLDIDSSAESLMIGDVLRCANPDTIQNMMETVNDNETIQNYQMLLEDEVLLEITGNIISEGLLILYLREVTESERTVSYNSVFRNVFGVTFSLQDADEIINLILKAAAVSTRVSCSFIFEEKDYSHYSYAYEWCNFEMGGSPQQKCNCKDINIIQSSYITLLKDNDSVVFNDINEIDPNDTEAFLPANVKAAALFPLFVSGKYFGFIGFANCNTARKWTNNDLMIFSDTTNLVSEVYARKQMEQLIADSQKVISNVLDNINTNIYVTDYETNELLFANMHGITELGITVPFEGKKCWELIYKRTSSKCDFCEKHLLLDDNGNYTGHRKREFLNEITNKWYYVENSLIKWIDGRMAFLETSIDFNERKALEEELMYYASTDVMTQIYNRAWGIKLLQDIVSAQNAYYPVTVCFIDVDGLKLVNDRYGHSEGDILLLTIVRALKNNITVNDSLSRLGGDEFMVVFKNSGYKQSEGRLLNTLKELNDFNGLHKKPYNCSFCYGLHQIEKDNTMTVDEIISYVDSKMYEQKKLRYKAILDKSIPISKGDTRGS